MNRKKLIMTSIVGTTIFSFASMIFSKNTITSDTSLQPNKSFYDLKLTTLEGEVLHLEEYRGKKVLIVNVASKCGFTPQYKSLQELYDKHSDKIEIIGVPCNDFGGQEPGSSSQIKNFCSTKYNVAFTLSEKQNIKSNPQSDLYAWLSNPELNGWNKKLPTWNFCKYLINENGQLTHFFQSSVNPMSEKILSLL